MSELYAVILLRKSQGGQLNLNFQSKVSAETVFDALSGELPRRATFHDDFGVLLNVEPGDVSHVIFQDVGRVLEYQSRAALMQARAQAKANKEAERDPMIRRPSGVLVPAGPNGTQLG